MSDKTLLFSTIIGSKLYGTDTTESDTDYINIELETNEQIYGISNPFKIKQNITDDSDIRNFSLKDFIRLNFKGNPNTIESLWAPQPIYKNTIFEKYFLTNDFKSLLINKNIINPHLGFAHSQVHKLISKQYVGEARKKLINKYGYDVKYASHAIRLMKQLEFAILYRNFIFPYPPEIRNLLLQIKNGDIKFSDFMLLFNNEYTRIKKLSDNFNVAPNLEAINKQLVLFYKEALC